MENHNFLSKTFSSHSAENFRRPFGVFIYFLGLVKECTCMAQNIVLGGKWIIRRDLENKNETKCEQKSTFLVKEPTK